MYLTVKEAFEKLKEEGITTHIESVRRWIRSGELKATKLCNSNKKGYRIKQEDLQHFINLKNPQELIEHEQEERLKFEFPPAKQFQSAKEEVIAVQKQLEALMKTLEDSQKKLDELKSMQEEK
ncbi:helix-turn-helix domain-containing protein [Bacillus mycoides]|uniref:helix-turn-helix domain-containing protein n=1 Tax=Bacillus mycoides TaxID=1405 RepID=UPI003F7C8959